MQTCIWPSFTVSCFSKILTGFTFLVPAHPGSHGKRAVKRVCVYVCILSVCSQLHYILIVGLVVINVVTKKTGSISVLDRV